MTKPGHRHAQLRNVDERIFGILKWRFRILRAPLEYPYATQVKLVFSLTALRFRTEKQQ